MIRFHFKHLYGQVIVVNFYYVGQSVHKTKTNYKPLFFFYFISYNIKNKNQSGLVQINFLLQSSDPKNQT